MFRVYTGYLNNHCCDIFFNFKDLNKKLKSFVNRSCHLSLRSLTLYPSNITNQFKSHHSRDDPNFFKAIRKLNKMDSSINPTTGEYFIEGTDKRIWEILIGLEMHAQINSKTKLFSSAPTDFGRYPNSQVSFFDAAIPGSLPTLNQECVNQAIRSGIILNGKIQYSSYFDRKHYFYGDLPSGYQITQKSNPIVLGGYVQIILPDYKIQNISIERIQLETDSGKSLHDHHPHLTYIDLNRAGCGLMEIVTNPDIYSPIQATLFVKKIQILLKHVGSCDGNMEEGSLRCDANVSVKYIDSDEIGTRCEIKNLNSIKSISRAIEYEAHRQVLLLEKGEKVEQETRFFDPTQRITYTIRKKEDTTDYRFFREPDLPPLIIKQELVQSLVNDMPEHPDQIHLRFLNKYGLSPYEADILSGHNGAYFYYEKLVEMGHDPKVVANWIINELFSYLNFININIGSSPLSTEQMSEILDLIKKDVITATTAKEIMRLIFDGDKRSPHQIVVDLGITKDCDNNELFEICSRIIKANSELVKEYKSGRERKMKFFVGEVMKLTKGKFDGNLVTTKFKEILSDDNWEDEEIL